MDYAVLSGAANSFVDLLEPHLPDELLGVLRSNAVPVTLAAATVAILILFSLLVRLSKGIGTRSVLLYGPVESGKTVLFHALQGRTLKDGTVTSMVASEATCQLPATKKQLRIVDIPGHPRLRTLLDDKINTAAGVIFVLDSSAFVVSKREIAECLYYVLRQLARRSRKPLLIACNKSDLGERAFSREFITSQLEKEVKTLRASHHSALSPGSDEGTDGLIQGDKPFSFESMSVPVYVCSVSGLSRDLDGLNSFLRKL